MYGYGIRQAARRQCFAVRSTIAAPPAIPATGVFFDSAAGDAFTDLLFAPQGQMTVNAGSLVFDKPDTGNLGMDLAIPGPDGQPLSFGFDRMEMECDIKFTRGPLSVQNGCFMGVNTSPLGIYGAEMNNSASSADHALFLRMRSGGNNSAGTAKIYGAGTLPNGSDLDLTVRYQRDAGVIRAIYVEEGVTTLPTVTINQSKNAGSTEVMRGWTNPIIRAGGGAWTMTRLKVSASHPNAPFAILGDSLSTLTSDTDRWGELLRASTGVEILISSAPGASVADYNTRIAPVLAMKPDRAIVALGVNDCLQAAGAATIQARMEVLAGHLAGAGIEPIFCNLPPINNGTQPQVNAWLAGQSSYRVIDIFTPLRDPALTGNPKLYAAYNSGDNIHWTDAGHAVVEDTVLAALQGWGMV